MIWQTALLVGLSVLSATQLLKLGFTVFGT